MRFAFAGFDLWCGVFDAFVAAGWEPVALFTMPVDNRHDFSDEVIARADQYKIPVQISRILDEDLHMLGQRQCDALVVAGHAWRIPDWRPHLPYAINFHPSPLPAGKGPYPLIRAILDGWQEWGVSCHRIEHAFDAGDVLASDRFPLTLDESHETLQLKLQLAMRRLATRVVEGFPRLWDTCQPQQGGSYWPRITDAERTLDFARPVAEIMRVVRACGIHECIAPISGGAVLHVRRAAGWEEPHSHAPGRIVHKYRRSIVVAAQDGFVALLEWSSLAPPLRAQVGP